MSIIDHDQKSVRTIGLVKIWKRNRKRTFPIKIEGQSGRRIEKVYNK